MPIDLILLDMDGTILQPDCSSFQSSWDMLGHATGRKEEWDALFNYYYPKPELQQEWGEKQFAFFQGINVQELLNKIMSFPYTPGFAEFCQYAHSKSIPLGIISSGLDIIANKILDEMHLNFFLTNHIDTKNGYFTGTGTLNFHLHEKGNIIHDLLTRHNCNPKNVMYIGDHTNDIPAWQQVGIPLGLNLKDKSCNSHVIDQFTNFYQIKTYLKNILTTEKNQSAPISVAVGALIFSNQIQDKILLIKRQRGDYVNMWALPGGKIEFNEHPSQAVEREFLEETRLTAHVQDYLGLVSEHYLEEGKQKKHFLLHVYKLITFNPSLHAGSEGSLQWFDLYSLDQYKSSIIPSDFMIIERLLLNHQPQIELLSAETPLFTPPPKKYYDCILEGRDNQYHLRKFS